MVGARGPDHSWRALGFSPCDGESLEGLSSKSGGTDGNEEDGIRVGAGRVHVAWGVEGREEAWIKPQFLE